MTGSVGATPNADWAVASRPHRGEVTSGDRHVLRETDDGCVFGAIDGLGHGSGAAEAANVAAEVVLDTLATDPVGLLASCEEPLRHSRGAAMTLGFVRWRDRTLTWAGIGNVEGIAYGISSGIKDSILLRAGIVGTRTVQARASSVVLDFGDTVALATDGILPEFRVNVTRPGTLRDTAVRVIDSCARSDDDALVFLLRLRGAGR